MKTIKFTLLDRIFSIAIGICILCLIIVQLNQCTRLEPEFTIQEIYEQSIDTLSEWDIFYLALVQVESRGNSNAIGKTNDVGIIQLTPIYVKEANRILGEDKFTLECRFSPELSREMFEIVNSHRNPNKCIKKAIKLHNPRAGKWYADRIYKEMDIIKTNYEYHKY